MEKRRVYFLDSLRGLAATSVVITHLAGSFAGESFSKDILQSFGRSAVILFFILSGIVLSMSLQKNKKLTWTNYISFLIKRFFRIYLPFLVIVICSFILFIVMQPHFIVGLSDWFNAVGTNVSTVDLKENLLMTGNRVERVDPVIWSLIIEMRVSFIFPILYFILRKKSWRTLLMWASIAFIVGAGILYLIGQKFLIGQTVFHIGFFIPGIGVFLYQSKLKAFVLKTKAQILTISLFLYFHIMLLNIMRLENIQVVSDIFIGIGTIGILLFCYHSSQLQQELHKSLYQKLGKYSFSIYLVHCVVFIPLIHLLYPYSLDFIMIEAISIPLIYIFAVLAYKSIERPSQLLGNVTCNKIIASMVTTSNLMKRSKKIEK
ncbi:acyltransferase family protein [Listeria aquatica]|uniref:acyltransferase family protein n=1 Tax=Listeria aquatica TaxID=1494960 RepID=UPI003F71FB10